MLSGLWTPAGVPGDQPYRVPAPRTTDFCRSPRECLLASSVDSRCTVTLPLAIHTGSLVCHPPN